MGKRIRAFLILPAVTALIFAAAGCGAAKPVAVTTAVAADRELTATLNLSGVLVPAHTAAISGQIAGKVTSLGFQTGNKVKAGDVLMQLDTAALNAQLAQAEASLLAAGAAAEAAGNQAALAKINLDSAQKSYDRSKALFAAGAVSQSAFDDATDALNIARKQYDNASGAALDQARAAVSTARANIGSLDVQLSETTIRSPLDGVLSGRNVNVGEVVSPGVAVMSVADDSSLKLSGTVTQDQLPLLSPGQEMDVTVDSFPGRVYRGTITTLGPIAVSTGEVFPIEITIRNDGRLMAGLTAHAEASVKAGGVVVPSSAVAGSGGSAYVFVVKDGVAVKRLVSTGLRSGNAVIVLKGLAAGEKVAVTNTGALADNMPVALQ
jgi:multidrug efflux pump subunit AcrA (membrane-fusion protein)